MTTLNDIQDTMHIGAAILHVDRYYRDELSTGELPTGLYNMLNKFEMIDDVGRLTPLGNEVFASPDLIRYWHQIQPELCSTSPRKMHYDTLRRGLAQHTKTRAIEYLDYIHSLGTAPNSVCDLGGGDGMYLQIICEHYGSDAVLVDNRVDPDTMDLPGDYKVLVEDFKAVGWSTIHPYQYSMVLLNEVLHLDIFHQQISDTISTALEITKPGGWVVIGENVRCTSLDWRISLLTKGGLLNYNDLVFLINEEFKDEIEEDIKVLTLDTHYYIALRKI